MELGNVAVKCWTCGGPHSQKKLPKLRGNKVNIEKLKLKERKTSLVFLLRNGIA